MKKVLVLFFALSGFIYSQSLVDVDIIKAKRIVIGDYTIEQIDGALVINTSKHGGIVKINTLFHPDSMKTEHFTLIDSSAFPTWSSQLILGRGNPGGRYSANPGSVFFNNTGLVYTKNKFGIYGWKLK